MNVPLFYLYEQLDPFPGFLGGPFELVVFLEQTFSFFGVISQIGGVCGQIAIAGIVYPFDGLFGGSLEEHVLLALIQSLLALGPVLQHFVFLIKQLLEYAFNPVLLIAGGARVVVKLQAPGFIFEERFGRTPCESAGFQERLFLLLVFVDELGNGCGFVYICCV